MKLYVLIFVLAMVLSLAGCTAGEYSVVATVSADWSPTGAEGLEKNLLPQPATVPETLDRWISP